MKKIIIILLFILLLTGCESKPTSDNNKIYKESLLAVKKGELWGYIDIDGYEAIPFEFIRATAFYQGLAIVIEQDNLYNIINEQGDTIFDEGFTNIYRDNDTKLLVVEKNGKFGLLDTKGETLVDQIGRAHV